MQQLLGLIATVSDWSERPFTIGIGLPGAIDPQSGLIKNCNCLVLNGHDLRHDLMRELGQPVWMANDADCFTLSEAVDGAGAGATTVFGVIIGTGCGGGIAVNQRLLSGPNAIVGEWGHNPLPGYCPERDGPAQPCYCGKENCIESFISGTGFARRYGEQAPAEAIIAAAQNGEPQALAHWRHFIDAFARSLASVINILDPQVIVLGGGLSNVGQIYEQLPSAIVPYLFSDSCRTQIKKARFGDASGVRGAAWLPVLAAAEGPRR
ncbi:putative fructokinase [Klebsiella oxytoca OK-1]|nr:putative fructokinase [Klebsiella oxytoca OK-1]